MREAEEFFSPGQKGSSAMPHKRNPVLTENLTGLARLVRSAVVPALENVALWHERDISHSSVERGIGPTPPSPSTSRFTSAGLIESRRYRTMKARTSAVSPRKRAAGSDPGRQAARDTTRQQRNATKAGKGRPVLPGG
jgi:hypothetical protein